MEKTIQENKFQETKVEGRNAVLEAFRSGKAVDKLFVLERCEDGPVRTILREAKKHVKLDPPTDEVPAEPEVIE